MGYIFRDGKMNGLAIEYSHLSLEERCPKNLPFCMACAIAYVGFIDAVSSHHRLAMHPEVSGQIPKLRDASIPCLGAAGLILHSHGEGDKKAGV
jgi:hypothetical protein